MLRETRLLQASQAGDQKAFEAIVAKYQGTVCAITFSGTGRCDVSEELAQETFLNAWRNLHQLRDLKGFRSWLYSIARNVLRNYYRQNKVVPEEVDPTELAARESDGPPEILIQEEERIMLEQAILRLPEKYREPLVLFCRQRRSVRETAHALGLSEATVRTRLHRARNLLREDMVKRLERVLEQTGPRRGQFGIHIYNPGGNQVVGFPGAHPGNVHQALKLPGRFEDRQRRFELEFVAGFLFHRQLFGSGGP